MGVALNPASRRFGRYELLEYLGSGGMSDVFVALHSGLRKRVALKMLRPSLRHESESVQRFLREGECAARVSHANVVDVTDVGMEQGIPYLVMELLEGETLEQKISREGPLSLQAAVDVLLPVLEGVAATHAAGVLHRDIKPANILLARAADGSVVPKLVDFGIATLEERRNITGALGPIGTPHYMSPEQARGVRTLDARSDQYSLASMLYEMLTGREPFAGGDVTQVLERVSRGKFPRVSDVRPECSIDDVLARATALDPARRYPSVSEFAHALLPFASERTRKLWLTREQRDGMLSAQLLSGTFRADNDAQRAPGLPTGLAPERPLAHQARTFTPGFLAAAVCTLVLGLLVGYLRTQGAVQPDKALAEAAPVLTAGAGKTARLPRTVYVTPANAEITFDGAHIGRGDFTLPALQDGQLHELRIAAEGHVTRVMLFKRELEAAHIALEPLSYAGR